jgi:hypothetical protein
MTIFTVHVPRDPVEPLVLAERVRFVADGFSWGAFVLGPLWLLWNRLWLALVLWIVAAGLVWLLCALGFRPVTLLGLGLMIEYLFGLEGNGLLASALRDRGLVLTDVVVASGCEAAARSYFRRLAQARPAAAAAAERMPPGRGDNDEFVGLSPDAGG